MSDPQPREHIKEWLLASTAAVTGVGIPLLIQFATGALDTPRNDDWAYTRILFVLFKEHQIRLIGWNDMTLIGHLIWPLPVLAFAGPSMRMLHAAEAGLSMIGLVSTYAVARYFLPIGRSLLVLAIAAVFPAFAVHAVSYMTDTPAFTAQMICLVLGIESIRRDDSIGLLLFWTALATGVWAFTIREFAIAALVAVIVGYALTVVQGKRRHLRLAVFGIAVCIAACIVFYLWRMHLSASSGALVGETHPYRLLRRFGNGLLRGYFTTALAIFPASIIGLARLWGCRRKISLVSGFIIGVVGLFYFETGHQLLLGNTIYANGFLNDHVTVGSRPWLVSPFIKIGFLIFTGLAGVCLAMTFVHLVHRRLDQWRSIPISGASPCYTILTVYLLVQLGCFGAISLLRQIPPFDRYLMAIVPTLAIIILHSSRNPAIDLSWPTVAVACAGWGVMFLTSSVLILNAAAFDAARWQTAQAMVSRSYDPASIDAGFEWVGFHSFDVVRQYAKAPGWNEPVKWYAGLFGRSGNCIIVSASLLSHARLKLLEIRPYRAFGFWGKGQLYVYRNEPSCAGFLSSKAGAG